MNPANLSKEYFFKFAEGLEKFLKNEEILTVYLKGENSDFVRFNTAKLRQVGNVMDYQVSLRVIYGNKHLSFNLRLSLDLKNDLKQGQNAIEQMRSLLPNTIEDPYLIYSDNPQQLSVMRSQANTTEEMIQTALECSKDSDFVGFLANGQILRGFYSTLGHHYWYLIDLFNFDWSIYLRDDLAIKSSYAGQNWNPSVFAEKVASSRSQLSILKKKPKKLDPGSYRVYLTPAALEEVFALWSWSGFSEKARKTKSAPFVDFLEGETKLSSNFSLSEDYESGFEPRFDRFGFLKTRQVPLIKNGEFIKGLASARTAKEYDLEVSSSCDEIPSSLNMAAGKLEDEKALKQLDTGIYCQNLWYLNFSDKQAGRITGMTRFGCFWVEDGEIVAPVPVLRFDDTFKSIFSENLEAIGSKPEFVLDSHNYTGRSLGSKRLPSLLLSNMKFTL